MFIYVALAVGLSVPLELDLASVDSQVKRVLLCASVVRSFGCVVQSTSKLRPETQTAEGIGIGRCQHEKRPASTVAKSGLCCHNVDDCGDSPGAGPVNNRPRSMI